MSVKTAHSVHSAERMQRCSTSIHSTSPPPPLFAACPAYPVLIIPIYIDSTTVMMGAICAKLKNMAKSEAQQEEVGGLHVARFPDIVKTTPGFGR